MSEWQPIETAPSGPLLILFFPKTYGKNHAPSWIQVEKYPVPYPRKPTHWMPLPKPPTE